jgi:MFS family permease
LIAAPALRSANFRLFILGQAVSLVGTWMQLVAQSWLVYRLTGSSIALGTIGFASQFPVFLFASVGGVAADRYSRRHLLLLTQSTMMALAFVLAWLTFSGRVQMWHLYTLAVCLGVANAFDIPVRQVFVVELVPRADLVNAIAINSSMVNGARVVGPALAGVLVASVGDAWCFLLNGLSYIAVIAGLLNVRLPAFAAPENRSPAWRSISEGFTFAARTPPVRALLVLLGLVSLTGMPYTVLMPVFADAVLRGGPSAYGVLMAASGIGALGGALTMTARKGVFGLGRWVAVSAGAFGASLVLFAASRSMVLSVILLVPVGASMLIEMAASNSLIQAMVPNQLRGRVMAVYSMMFMGMAPFGALLAGVLADGIGAPGAVAAGGVVCMLGAGFFRARLPVLRAAGRELILAQEMAAGQPPDEVSRARVR